MGSSSRSWLLVAVLSPGVMGCATLGGLSDRDVVTLRYEWPEKAIMRVVHTLDVRSDWDGRQTAQRRFTMTLGPADETGARRLGIHDVEVLEAPFPAFVQPLATSIIDAQGAFQGIDPLEDGPGEAFLDALPLSPSKKAEVLKGLANGLEQDARERWGQWVGSWYGARYKPGRQQVLTSTISVGVDRKRTQDVPAEDRETLHVGVPCSSADPEPRCVRLHAIREPVGQQNDDRQGRYAHVELELVTDPATLLPHSSRIIRMDRWNWAAKGEPADFHESMRVEQYTFIHGVEASPGAVAAASARAHSLSASMTSERK
jgi:hypothetical protein